MDEPEVITQRPLGPDDSCDCNPEFVVICSFIKTFGSKIDLELNIEQLKNSIENQEILDENLVDIHVKLFKKLRRYFIRDQWEKALIKFANEYSYEDACEIERFGYLKTRPSVKLHLLSRLLDAQFECDQKFKASVNLEEANDLRTQPVGRDIQGNTYWYCFDNEGNFRIFSEEPIDYKSWKLVCKSIDDLRELISNLERTKDNRIKGERQSEPYNPYPEIFPEFFTKLEDSSENQDAIQKRKFRFNNRNCHPGVTSKSSPLTPLQEINDISSPIKTEHKPAMDRGTRQPITHTECASKPPSPESLNVDSQVRQTIDNLISKVVASFEFFFRRSSDVNAKLEISDSPALQGEPAVKTKKRNAKRVKVSTEELPRRTSSRIQQLQQKKITDYLEKAGKEPDPSNESTRIRVSRSEQAKTNFNGHSKPSKRPKKDKQRWRKSTKKRISWDKDDSDLSSISSVTDSNDESFLEEINERMNHDATYDEDEFACEDEDNNGEPVIIKRARTARQSLAIETDGKFCTNSIIEEDKPCGRCDKSDDAEWILLCDMCDDGYHTTCCVPPLMFVPDGDWFCPSCEHRLLTNMLNEILLFIDSTLAAKERERQKRQKSRQRIVNRDPPIPPIEQVKRNRNDLPELNEPLAVQALDEILGEESDDELPKNNKERNYKRKRKPARRRNKRQRWDSDDEIILDRKSRQERSRRKITENDALDYGLDISSTDEERQSVKSSSVDWGSESSTDEWESEQSEKPTTEESSEEEEEHLQTRKARARVNYSFQEYDELIRSAIGADSDHGETSERDSDGEHEGTRTYGRGKDMATIEALAYQQENGITEPVAGGINSLNAEPEPDQRGTKPTARKRGRKLNDLDAESEIDIATSDESFQASESEIEEDDITEVEEESDSSIDELVASFRLKREKHRKAQKYFSESDDDDY